MKIEELLKQLAHDTGVADLALNDGNVCRVVFDERLTVDIEAVPGGEAFFLHAVVCAVTPGHETGLYAQLLSAHLFGTETGDACFGLDQNHNDILLFQKLNAEQTDYQAFVSALEVFVDRLEYWKDKTGSLGAGESADSSVEPPLDPIMSAHRGIIKP